MQWVYCALMGIAVLCAFSTHAEVKVEHCLSDGWTEAQLVALKATRPTDTDVQSLALQLRHCLASADPVLRDEVAFGLLSQWMRDDQLTEATRLQLLTALSEDIAERHEVEEGVYLPFALLVLSEVVRTDRISPFLTEKQRENTIHTVSSYLHELSDYRGFSEEHGWRHNVAHGADVYLQLGLNTNVTAAQLRTMAESLAELISPSQPHFYHYSEPQRLARATAYLMLREEQTLTFWRQWLSDIASSAPFEEWNDVFHSEKGLAKRHNTRAFLLELNTLIQSSSNSRLQEISIIIEKQLKAIA